MEIIKANRKKPISRGRKPAEGKKHQYVVADDVHEWIMRQGGSKYINDTFRAIKAVTPEAEQR